jgi:hypothetical protein
MVPEDDGTVLERGQERLSGLRVRLLRGQNLELVSRELGVIAAIEPGPDRPRGGIEALGCWAAVL